MDTAIVAIIVIVALGGLAAAYLLVSQRKRSAHLRDRFGPEYKQVVSSAGKRGAAEKELAEREARVQRLRIKPLSTELRKEFSAEWQKAQSHFVDDPTGAITEADRLVQRVMDERGYPITNFDQQAADISVDHPMVVSHYRTAHQIAEANQQNMATTEDLRQAMVHYRALFAELLEARTAA